MMRCGQEETEERSDAPGHLRLSRGRPVRQACHAGDSSSVFSQRVQYSDTLLSGIAMRPEGSLRIKTAPRPPSVPASALPLFGSAPLCAFIRPPAATARSAPGERGAPVTWSAPGLSWESSSHDELQPCTRATAGVRRPRGVWRGGPSCPCLGRALQTDGWRGLRGAAPAGFQTFSAAVPVNHNDAASFPPAQAPPLPAAPPAPRPQPLATAAGGRQRGVVKMVTATASVAPRPPAVSWDEAGPGESPAAVRGQGGGQRVGAGGGRGAAALPLRVTSPLHLKSAQTVHDPRQSRTQLCGAGRLCLSHYDTLFTIARPGGTGSEIKSGSLSVAVGAWLREAEGLLEPLNRLRGLEPIRENLYRSISAPFPARSTLGRRLRRVLRAAPVITFTSRVLQEAISQRSTGHNDEDGKSLIFPRLTFRRPFYAVFLSSLFFLSPTLHPTHPPQTHPEVPYIFSSGHDLSHCLTDPPTKSFILRTFSAMLSHYTLRFAAARTN
ncbi:hypothetical protein E2C01_019076 [Portunus trituberculatus]|uniref:Uncharacterized protein n=1 Tax=Portunus trituberculatus TaxID=210409 RepID=A0A5B7DWA2_PORTR|nr:hypothetical protein [Portunus trituberculatus]